MTSGTKESRFLDDRYSTPVHETSASLLRLQATTVKKVIAFFWAFMAIASLIAVAKANRSNDIRTLIMRLFPQADTNGDGIISDKEEEAPAWRALARHPDADGDGALSTKEKHALLTMVAQKPQKTNSNFQCK